MFILLTFFCILIAYTVYQLYLAPKFNPLRLLPGPPLHRLFGSHLYAVMKYAFLKVYYYFLPLLSPAVSAKVYDSLVRKYGRSVRIVGVGPVRHAMLS